MKRPKKPRAVQIDRMFRRLLVGDVGTINSFKFHLLLGARTSSSATRRQSRRLFASLIADEDVRAPSKNLQLTTRNFLGYRFEAFDELLESLV
jgi:hypothetical protein